MQQIEASSWAKACLPSCLPSYFAFGALPNFATIQQHWATTFNLAATFSLKGRLWPLLQHLTQEERLRFLATLDKAIQRKSLHALSKEQVLASLQGLSSGALRQLAKELSKGQAQPTSKLSLLSSKQQLHLLQTRRWQGEDLLLLLARLSPKRLAQLAYHLDATLLTGTSFKRVMACLFNAPPQQLLAALGLLSHQELSLLVLGLQEQGTTSAEALKPDALHTILQNASKEALLQGLSHLSEQEQQAQLTSLPNNALLQVLQSLAPEYLLACFIREGFSF